MEGLKPWFKITPSIAVKQEAERPMLREIQRIERNTGGEGEGRVVSLEKDPRGSKALERYV